MEHVPGRTSTVLRRGGRSLLAVLLIGLSAGATAGATAGADGVSMALSPSRLVFETQPGDTTAADLTVYNQGDAALDLTITVGDFLVDDSDDATRTFAVVDWVRTEVDSLRLEARSQADIRVIVDVPPEAAPGGYQAGLFVLSAPSGSSPVAVSGRLGAALLIELAPEGRPLRREIQVSSHALTVDFPDQLGLDSLFAPVGRAETTVRNVGETFVRAVAVDRYRSWLAKDPTEHQATGTSVLRGADGRFTTTEPGLPWIGPASVTTEIVYERGAQDYATIVVQAETFVVPWRLLGLALVVAAALVGTILWRRRSGRIRRRAADATGTGR